jgi:hypothetical protein
MTEEEHELEIPPPTEEHELAIPLPIKIAFAIVTLLFFATLLGFSFVVNSIRDVSNKNTALLAQSQVLNRENKARINEIQSNRLETCKEIYRGVRKVFRPFFPPPPRTKQQVDDIEKFNLTVDKLVASCGEFVNPPPG